jgi:hypothetical protein
VIPESRPVNKRMEIATARLLRNGGAYREFTMILSGNRTLKCWLRVRLTLTMREFVGFGVFVPELTR